MSSNRNSNSIQFFIRDLIREIIILSGGFLAGLYSCKVIRYDRFELYFFVVLGGAVTYWIAEVSAKVLGRLFNLPER